MHKQAVTLTARLEKESRTLILDTSYEDIAIQMIWPEEIEVVTRRKTYKEIRMTHYEGHGRTGFIPHKLQRDDAAMQVRMADKAGDEEKAEMIRYYAQDLDDNEIQLVVMSMVDRVRKLDVDDEYIKNAIIKNESTSIECVMELRKSVMELQSGLEQENVNGFSYAIKKKVVKLFSQNVWVGPSAIVRMLGKINVDYVHHTEIGCLLLMGTDRYELKRERAASYGYPVYLIGDVVEMYNRYKHREYYEDEKQVATLCDENEEDVDGDVDLNSNSNSNSNNRNKPMRAEYAIVERTKGKEKGKKRMIAKPDPSDNWDYTLTRWRETFTSKDVKKWAERNKLSLYFGHDEHSKLKDLRVIYDKYESLKIKNDAKDKETGHRIQSAEANAIEGITESDTQDEDEQVIEDSTVLLEAGMAGTAKRVIEQPRVHEEEEQEVQDIDLDNNQNANDT